MDKWEIFCWKAVTLINSSQINRIISMIQRNTEMAHWQWSRGRNALRQVVQFNKQNHGKSFWDTLTQLPLLLKQFVQCNTSWTTVIIIHVTLSCLFVCLDSILGKETLWSAGERWRAQPHKRHNFQVLQQMTSQCWTEERTKKKKQNVKTFGKLTVFLVEHAIHFSNYEHRTKGSLLLMSTR